MLSTSGALPMASEQTLLGANAPPNSSASLLPQTHHCPLYLLVLMAHAAVLKNKGNKCLWSLPKLAAINSNGSLAAKPHPCESG